MSDVVKLLEEHLEKKKAELQKLQREMDPLERKRIAIQEDMRAYEHLIASEKRNSEPVIEQESLEITGVLVGKRGLEAYKELAAFHFGDRAFKEKDIRDISNQEGLRIRGKPISGSYSRNLIIRLLDEGLLEKVERGSYRATELFMRGVPGAVYSDLSVVDEEANVS